VIRSSRGAVLVSTFVIMTTLIAMTMAFLYLTSKQTLSSRHDFISHEALWLVEAGIEKAIWNLKTPTGSGGQGENWTTTGVTENLGAGNYKMEVVRWDWNLASNGGVATATTEEVGHEGSKVIDDDDATYWETKTKPLPPGYEHVTIAFPYKLTLNKARYYLPPEFDQKRPKEYEWRVSTNGTTYTTVFSSSTGTTDETNEFSPVEDVTHLRLYVTKIGGGALGDGMIVATVEAIGSKITSTSTVDGFQRKAEVTAAIDDPTAYAFAQIDWKELAP
jgi:hypothetical protein